MLGLFGSSKRDKFNFAIELHHLAPFPELPSNRLLTLAWNRGKKRQGRLGGGYTRPFVSVPRGRGRLGHEIQMGYQTIELGATLEKLPRNGSALQEYKKKCLVVALLETNAFTGDATPVGRVVMDLADFALINGQETRSFIVTCKKEIIQQVGHPQLLVTIRNLGTKGSRLSMSSSGGGRTSSGRLSSAVMDDTASDDATSVSSYGTEQSGSGSAVNASSFLRYKYTGQMPAVSESAEQDLEGFEGVQPPGSTPNASPLQESKKDDDRFRGPCGAVPSGASLRGFMGTIQESQDSDEDEARPRVESTPPPAPVPAPTPAPAPTPKVTEAKPEAPAPPAGGRQTPEEEAHSIAETILALPHDERGPLLSQMDFHKRAEVVKAIQKITSKQQPKPPVSPAPAPTPAPAPAAAPSPPPAPAAAPSPPPAPAAAPSPPPAPAQPPVTPPPKAEASRQGSEVLKMQDDSLALASSPSVVHPFCDLEALQQELLCTAAQEACVLLARASATSPVSGPKRAYHGPARRLARTLVCLGPTQTSDFALHLLRLIAAQVRTASMPTACELPTLAFWWSNLTHLRALLLLPKVSDWLSLPLPSSSKPPAQEAPSDASSTAAANGGAEAEGSKAPASGRKASSRLVAAMMPNVARLERAAADMVVEHVWNEVMLPAVTAGTSTQSVSASTTMSTSKSMDGAPPAGAGGDAAAGPDNKGAPARSNMAAKRALQEGAMQRWAASFEHLGRVLGQLSTLPTNTQAQTAAASQASTQQGSADAKPAEQQQSQQQQQQQHGGQQGHEGQQQEGEQQQQQQQKEQQGGEGQQQQQEGEQQKQQEEQEHEPEEAARAVGHVALLQKYVLAQCLARTDALLFFHLLTPPGTDDTSLLADYIPAWVKPGCSVPQLSDAALPFTRGLLSFGSGMHIKMAVTRFQQWANSCDAKLGAHPSLAHASGPPPRAFPLLRGAADLLMMPKELLLDEAVRNDVYQALTVRSMLHMVRGFQADEYAPEEGSGASVLAQLQELPEVAAAMQSGAPADRRYQAPEYHAPAGEALHGQVLMGTEPGVEYDADSENELLGPQGLAKRAAGSGKQVRFEMLHNLWASKRALPKA